MTLLFAGHAAPPERRVWAFPPLGEEGCRESWPASLLPSLW